MNLLLLGTGLIAFVLTFLMICLLKPFAGKINLLDRPGGRKQHRGAVPVIGGAAIFIVVAFLCLLLLSYNLQLSALFAALTLLVVTGIIDDAVGLSPRLKLTLQVLTALLVIVWGQTSISEIGSFLNAKHVGLHYLAWPLSLLFLVGFTNASNMLDGADGVLGITCLVQFIALFCISLFNDQSNLSLLIVIAIGALLAFLILNAPLTIKHKGSSLFMGDAGSLVLGFLTAWLCIELSQTFNVNKLSVYPMTYAWIVALPVFDLARVSLVRLKNRAGIFSADREHLHHILHDLGLSPLAIMLAIGGTAILFCLLGTGFNLLQEGQTISLAGLVLCFVIFLLSMHKLRNRAVANRKQGKVATGENRV
jgi:UDP-GlcNAc:undecaprenyl-phosphate GlcNAc-1-phosphate transferase